MAKISTYSTKATPVGDDKLIGTDSADSNSTKNFLISELTSDVKSYTFRSTVGETGVFYLGGYYDAPAAESALTQASLTQTLGTANVAYGAHAFAVAKEAGVTDGSDLVLTVSGTSITDEGVRTGGDSEAVVATATGASTDDYFETAKKWIGQVTYTLSSTAGGTFNFSFNYGLAKYEDFNNTNFTVTGVEFVGQANANDAGFDLEIIHHKDTGWTYSAGAFVAGDGALSQMSVDYSTERQLVNGQPFAYKRADLDTDVVGSDSEGVLLRITTTANGAVQFMDGHILIVRT